jgi:phospholipid N-methyltransferase
MNQLETRDGPSSEGVRSRARLPSPGATIAAYGRLAGEYGDPRHETTRELERLSAAAFYAAKPLASSSTTKPAMLELGAGTGALSQAAMAGGHWSSLVLTDPAGAMCALLDKRFSGVRRIQVRQCHADSALRTYGPQSDFVFAGLADPFLNRETLAAAHFSIRAESLLFMTVPTHRWARRERAERLKIPVNRTRFLLRNGTRLEADSWTYDEEDLTALMRNIGFLVIDSGTNTSASKLHGASPEVAWALVKST